MEKKPTKTYPSDEATQQVAVPTLNGNGSPHINGNGHTDNQETLPLPKAGIVNTLVQGEDKAPEISVAVIQPVTPPPVDTPLIELKPENGTVLPQQALTTLEAERELVAPPPLENRLPVYPVYQHVPEPLTVLPPPPPEVPVIYRNPGPPPRLPRNLNVTNLGRTSYRFKEISAARPNYRLLLWLCAFIGVGLLYLLLIVKPQNRLVDNPDQTPASSPRPSAPFGDDKIVISPVLFFEQFGIVTVQEGLVLEEPRAGSILVQNLSRYTYIAFQKKSSNGWYQLRGGSGWILADQVKTFATEEAAWAFKREQEKK